VDGTQVASTPATATLFISTGALKIGGNAIWASGSPG
jgi:hypothetical protein